MALRQITGAAELGELLADIVPLLHLSDEPGEEKAVQYALSEMTRNVLEHSQSPFGAVVCAQLYRGKDTVKKVQSPLSRRYISIGVADAGIGVRSTLARTEPGLDTDRDAVLRAMEFGTTGAIPGVYGTGDNAGAGLYFTRRLSWATARYFALASGDALFKLSQRERQPRDDQLVAESRHGPALSCAVEIGLDWELNFEDFLKATRASYSARSQEASERAERLLVFLE